MDLPVPVKVLISYSHDSPEHENRVLDLADRLRADGIDAIIDQYESFPRQGWARWTDTQIRESNFVAMVCTETYYRRVIGKEEEGKGLGVLWEAHLIYDHFYVDGVVNTKFVPLLFHDSKISDIPDPFRTMMHYRMDTEEGYDGFCRLITNQPRVKKPDLGKMKSLPPRERQQSFSSITNLPPRNTFFTGRDQVLTDLRDRLTNNKTTAISQAISGLGGIGKTQTAVEYAYRHQDDYKAVFWIKAETRDEIVSGFAEVARLLNLPEKDATNPDDAARAVIQWLETNEGWLVIFDNADDPKALKPFFPRSHRGHILLTSRAQVFHEIGIAKPVELESMLPDDAVQFLFTRTGRDINNGKEKEAAKELARELGYLPLALEQAGAYVVEQQARIQDYLSSFRRRRLELLNEAGPIAGDYPASVTTTWALNFEQIEKVSEAAADLLRVSAFLSPDQIPFELIVKGCGEISPALANAFSGAEDDPLRINQILKPLMQYSLIRVDPDLQTYSIHRLVQEVIKDKLDRKTQRLWAERAVRSLNEAFPDATKFENWPLLEVYSPHAKLAAQLIDEFELEFEQAALLLNETGYYMKNRGQYAATLPLYQRALAIREKALGPDHSSVAASLNNLAELYRTQGNYKAASPLYQQALAIFEKVLGPDHAYVATSLNNLALLYANQGNYEDALPLYKRALAIDEKVLGSDNSDVATDLNNLAELYRDQGDYDAALPLQQRALAILEKTLSPDHPYVAFSLNNLGLLYKNQGNYDAALPLYQRALVISEKALGPDHPNVATALNNYSLLLREMNRKDEADKLLARSKAIRAKHAQQNPGSGTP